MSWIQEYGSGCEILTNNIVLFAVTGNVLENIRMIRTKEPGLDIYCIQKKQQPGGEDRAKKKVMKKKLNYLTIFMIQEGCDSIILMV